MRIISKFHDYYDSAQSHGLDQSLVFVREHKEYSHAFEDLPAGAQAFHRLASHRTPVNLSLACRESGWRGVEVYGGLVLFVGRLYPYARVEVYRGSMRMPAKTQVHYVFSYDKLAALLEESHVDSRNKARVHEWRAFFELAGSEQLMSVAIEHHLVIARWFAWAQELTINPRLAETEFYRQVDAWQAFQEISMFLGGLAHPDRVPVEVSAKDRIVQHGFDKWSFRKRPGADHAGAKENARRA